MTSACSVISYIAYFVVCFAQRYFLCVCLGNGDVTAKKQYLVLPNKFIEKRNCAINVQQVPGSLTGKAFLQLTHNEL